MMVNYLPSTSIRTRNDVDALIRRLRVERIGKTQEDLVPRLSAYAAPVFDHLGRIVAAVSLIAPTGMVQGEPAQGISSRLAALADRLSMKLGRDPAALQTTYIEMVEQGAYRDTQAEDLPARKDMVLPDAGHASAQEGARTVAARRDPAR